MTNCSLLIFDPGSAVYVMGGLFALVIALAIIATAQIVHHHRHH